MNAAGKTFLAIAALACVCCSPGIKRSIIPIENKYIAVPGNGPALVRSAACDIFLEHVSPDKWKKVLSCKQYSRGNPAVDGYDIPPFEFFQFTIRNTSDAPVTVQDCWIRWTGGTVKSLSVQDLDARCAGGRYRVFDFGGLYRARRMTGRSFTIQDTDYARDTIGARVPFIPANDTAVLIRAFDWIPAAAESFDVVLSYRAGSRESSVALTMMWKEYRTGGKDFTEPRRKAEEDSAFYY